MTDLSEWPEEFDWVLLHPEMVEALAAGAQANLAAGLISYDECSEVMLRLMKGMVGARERQEKKG